MLRLFYRIRDLIGRIIVDAFNAHNPFVNQATVLTNALTWTMNSIRAIGYAIRSMRTPTSIGFALNGAVVASPSTPVAA